MRSPAMIIRNACPDMSAALVGNIYRDLVQTVCQPLSRNRKNKFFVWFGYIQTGFIGKNFMMIIRYSNTDDPDRITVCVFYNQQYRKDLPGIKPVWNVCDDLGFGFSKITEEIFKTIVGFCIQCGQKYQ